jgi:hypothetical protein
VVSRKTLAWALVASGLIGAQARSDSLSSSGGWNSWTAWTSASGNGSPVTQVAAEVMTPPPVASSSSSSSSSPAGSYDGFVNLGAGPFPNAGTITTGNAQSWYQSAAITGFFGGQPTAQQQTAFANTVMQRVEQTFQLSGVPVTLTDNPNATAAHTLSLVSNTAAQLLPPAIGMTYIGGNGFSFIDQEAKSAQSLDQLEWIVAHNLSHELMLAFGVGENYDQSGNFVDARNANLSMMLNPSATFSTAAAQALNQALQAANSTSSAPAQFAQTIDPKPVPEPQAVAIWGLGTLCVTLRLRSRRARG